MALRFIDGFDYYTTDAEIALKWDALSGSGSDYQILSSGGARGGGCLELYTNSGFVRKNFDDQNTWIIGLRLFMESLPSSNTQMVYFQDSLGNTQFSLYVTTTGAVVAYRGTTTVLATSAVNLVAGAWQYLECKVTIHDTAGACIVRVGENEIINISGVDTKYTSTAGARSIGIKGGASAVKFRYDDVVIMDATGSVNNDFLGDVRVDALLPSAAGATTDFTANGGANNWDNVNDSSIDGDTTYNSSATVGATDTFAFSDLPAATGDIYGVQASLYARKDDAGAGSMSLISRVNSTDYASASVAMTDTYARSQAIWETNPDTAAAWTATEINGAEFGYRVAA